MGTTSLVQMFSILSPLQFKWNPLRRCYVDSHVTDGWDLELITKCLSESGWLVKTEFDQEIDSSNKIAYLIDHDTETGIPLDMVY